MKFRFLLLLLLTACNNPTHLLEEGTYEVELYYEYDSWPQSRADTRSVAKYLIRHTRPGEYTLEIVGSSGSIRRGNEQWDIKDEFEYVAFTSYTTLVDASFQTSVLNLIPLDSETFDGNGSIQVKLRDTVLLTIVSLKGHRVGPVR